MFLLLMVLVLVVVLFVIIIATLVKGNESLKAQHRAYVSSVNSVYDNHSNIIIGLQGQVEDMLAQRADDQDVIANKDNHIAGLVKEIGLKEKTINDLSFKNEVLELRVKEARKTSEELYQALKEASK